jgi:hypothetical protein
LDLPFPHNVEPENEEEGNGELSGRFGNGGWVKEYMKAYSRLFYFNCKPWDLKNYRF